MSKISRRTGLKVIYWNVVIAVLVVSLAFVLLVRRIHQYDTLIVEIGKETGMDSRLIASVIWQESRFVPTRTGEAGEIGLMQVTYAVALDWADAAKRADLQKTDLPAPLATGPGRAVRATSPA